MRWHPKFLGAIVTVCLVSCTPSMSVRPDPSVGPIEFTAQLRSANVKYLDNLMVKLVPPKTESYASYQTWKADWCPGKAPILTVNDVRNTIREYCSKHQGVMQQSGACISTQDFSRVMFLADVVAGSGCQGTATVDVRLIVPNAGMEFASGYQRALSNAGYVSPQRDAFMEAYAAARAEAVREANEVRYQHEMPLLNTRGTQVCQNRGSMTYVGSVEDSNAGKIKVQMIGYGRTGTIGVAGHPFVGVTQAAIWDWPTNWHVCQ